jgi:hypothetical protein
VLAVTVLLSACGGGDKKGVAAVAGTFVGKASDGRSLVAVVAAPPASEGQPRKVSVYACDGQQVNVWLPGETGANQAELTSQGGARATVTLAPNQARGTITLRDGKKLSFTANPAKGAAGLYNVTLAPGGSITGSSQTGGRLTARLGEQARPGLRLIDGNITIGGGQQVKLSLFGRSATPGDYRWVVLANGRAYGGKNGDEGGRAGVLDKLCGGACARPTDRL